MAEETPQTIAQLVRSHLMESEIDAMFIDGFDEAVIGVGNQFNTTLVVYSKAKILDKLMSEGCTDEEALEYFEFNIAGAWVGEHTPFIFDDFFVEWGGVQIPQVLCTEGFNLQGNVRALIDSIKRKKYSGEPKT